MPTPTRAAPHAILGVLTLLSVAAIFVSANSAPPVAQKQLQLAAASTAAAESFVLVDTSTAAPAGTVNSPAARTETATLVYQAPDRARETIVGSNGQSVTLLAIGPRRYVQSAPGHWLGYTAPTGVSYGAEAAQALHIPAQSVADGAVDVVAHGDRFTFGLAPATEADKLLVALLGYQAGQLTPGTLSLQATVSGEFLTGLEATAEQNGRRLDAKVTFSHVGAAPALVPPPAAEITPAGG
ncbi:MAG: hypothetical protein ACYDA2_00140 [Acidimicrobiales bacterium]